VEKLKNLYLITLQTLTPKIVLLVQYLQGSCNILAMTL